jgi:glycerophosphoryl diester phosphodiesterase
MKSLRDFVKDTKVFIVGHRGSSGTAPENTFASFSEALKNSSAMVEADIHFSKDNKIVTVHDFSNFDEEYSNGKPSDFLFEDIQKIDAGNWFNPKFKGERIPLFEDVIDLICGKAYLNIEIKEMDLENHISSFNEILSVIKAKNYENHFMISSFNYKILNLIKNFGYDIPTAAIQIPHLKMSISEIAQYTGCEGFICDINDVNEEIVHESCNNNLYLAVYNIETIEHLQKALDFGIKAIATDYPEKIKQMLDSLNITLALP